MTTHDTTLMCKVTRPPNGHRAGPNERVRCDPAFKPTCTSQHSTGASVHLSDRYVWWTHAENWDEVARAMRDPRWCVWTFAGAEVVSVNAWRYESEGAPTYDRGNLSYRSAVTDDVLPLAIESSRQLLVAVPALDATEQEINEAVASILGPDARPNR